MKTEFELTDPSDIARKLKVNVWATGGFLQISIEGYGDFESDPPLEGVPVLLDFFDGEVKAHVYSDINDCEPTHTISLADAHESKRLPREAD